MPCPACGYNLRGLKAVCPEWGDAGTRADSALDRGFRGRQHAGVDVRHCRGGCGVCARGCAFMRRPTAETPLAVIGLVAAVVGTMLVRACDIEIYHDRSAIAAGVERAELCAGGVGVDCDAGSGFVHRGGAGRSAVCLGGLGGTMGEYD